MTTALETYREMAAVARVNESVDIARRATKAADVLIAAYGVEAEAKAWAWAAEDPRYRRVALMIREAMR